MGPGDERRSALDLARLSDEELMEEIVRRSEEAFAALVTRYQNRIVNVVSRLINDRDRAQEIAQETFLRVFIHRERYRPSGKFSTWLYTIAMNLAKNEIRRRVRARGVVSLDKLMEVAGDSGGFIADPGSRPRPALPTARGGGQGVDGRREAAQEVQRGHRAAGHPAALLRGDRGCAEDPRRHGSFTHQPGPAGPKGTVGSNH